MHSNIVIVGGGIAGLSAAWALGKRFRNASIVLVEREPSAFSHSSGSNAAIYRPLESSRCISELALRSWPLLEELRGSAPVLEVHGLVLAGRDERALSELNAVAAELGIAHAPLRGDALQRVCPALAGGENNVAIHLPQAGVLNLEALAAALTQRVLAQRVQLRFGVAVRGLSSDGRRVTGLELHTGEHLAADAVVLASGAWSATLAETCGVTLPLVPHRRHLAELRTERRLPAHTPPVWSVDLGVYFRPSKVGVLACPGDQTPHPAARPELDALVIARLPQLLQRFAPELGPHQVHSAWACLRTVTPDAEAVVGADASTPGLYWFAGLGGFGMSTGLAAGELLATALAGQHDALLQHWSPARFASAAERDKPGAP